LNVAPAGGSAATLINASNNGTVSTVTIGDASQANLTVNNTGVHVANGGGYATISGVADGVDGHDAVNVNQLNRVSRKAYSGIAQVAAMATIPAPAPGHSCSIGVGAGTFGGEQGYALGFKGIVTDNIMVGVSAGIGSSSPAAAAIGASYSW
jgi:autotransporter adhesin